MKKILFVLCMMALAMQGYALERSILQAHNPQLKLMKSLQAPTASEMTEVGNDDVGLTMMKLGPQKAFNSISDLYGTWMVNYSNGTQQYFTITISGGLSTGQVVISGWWIGSLATDITGTVSLAGGQGTLSIPSNQLVVNVDGYQQGFLVNTNSPSSPIKLNIYSSGMSTSTKWSVVTSEGGTYESCTGMTICKKANGTMRYSYDGTIYTDPVVMGQNGIGGASKLSIYNFYGLGIMMDIDMKSDSTFEITPTLLYTDSDTGGRYYCYGTDGNSRWNITGHGTETHLIFDTNWSLCSPSTDEWIGLISNTTIFYTDESTFKYPEATPESISLNITDADNQVVEPGSAFQLVATILPSNASQEVTWTSSDETVATVDANGLVTALPESTSKPHLEGGGKTVTITATSVAKPELSASVRLFVGYPITGLWGDLNFDGEVDVRDITILIGIIMGEYDDVNKFKLNNIKSNK